MKKIGLLFTIVLVSGICFAQAVFGPEQVITTNADYAYSVYAIDLDSDGDIDVLSASRGDSKIAWYKNDGAGNFSDQKIIATDAIGVFSVFAIDLDNDGDNDVLSASGDFDNGKIAWYENDGAGNFSGPKIISDAKVISIYAIDLDNDGDNDVLFSTEGKIAWLKNDGTGNFGDPLIITMDILNVGRAVFSIDIDGDNDNDVLYSDYSNPGSGKIAWHENDGAGNFSDQKIITNSDAISLHAIDLDNDGDNDVLYCDYGEIAWHENDGAGNFGNQKIITTGIAAFSVYAIDLDNDGDNDVLSAVHSNKIIWYENDGFGNFGEGHIITNNLDYPASVFAIDLDNDNDADILSASSFDNKIAWYENLLNHNYYTNYEICEGDSLLIGDSWISEAGTYFDTLTNMYGGDSLLIQTVSLLPLPDSFNIAGKTDVDELEITSYTVPVNASMEYTWDIENGNIVETLMNSVEIQWGSYGPGKVYATATYLETGCSRLSMLEVFVGDNGIIDLAQTDIVIRPNPVDDALYLEGNDLRGSVVELFTITGKLVLKEHIESSDVTINLKNLSPGVITVKITGTFGTSIQKIMKR
jgi:hypothetical protein